MVARLPLGAGHELQEHAVAAALRNLLLEGRRGVVLADEVGFGKTYEALAVMALLHDHAVERRWSADELRSAGLRGRRRDGHIQVPNGLYIVNHDLMSEKARATRRPLLTQLWNTQWDLIIVDEAHHYARWNRPAYLF